jgi:hypothetical protein
MGSARDSAPDASQASGADRQLSKIAYSVWMLDWYRGDGSVTERWSRRPPRRLWRLQSASID